MLVTTLYCTSVLTSGHLHGNMDSSKPFIYFSYCQYKGSDEESESTMWKTIGHTECSENNEKCIFIIYFVMMLGSTEVHEVPHVGCQCQL